VALLCGRFASCDRLSASLKHVDALVVAVIRKGEGQEKILWVLLLFAHRRSDSTKDADVALELLNLVVQLPAQVLVLPAFVFELFDLFPEHLVGVLLLFQALFHTFLLLLHVLQLLAGILQVIFQCVMLGRQARQFILKLVILILMHNHSDDDENLRTLTRSYSFSFTSSWIVMLSN